MVPVKVTVMGYVPGVVPASGVIPSVEEAPELIDCGVKDTVAPEGAPEALSPTVWEAPWVTVVVTVTLVRVPATLVADTGTPTEKSLGWAATARLKAWLAGLPAPAAVMVIRYEGLDPAAGVPARVAVPFPLSVKVTPFGSGPDSDRAAVRLPVVVTVKVPAVPWVKVVVAGEVMAAGVLTVREKLAAWDAEVPVPVTVTGYVPAGVAAVVVMDRLELPPEVTEVGLNWAEAPAGSPVAVKPTVWGAPERVAVEMVLVAGVPTTALPEVGVAVTEKSPGGGGGLPALNRAMPAAQYMAVEKVPA